ncbi:hypothetical protein [Paenibacillus arenilitoris]|uniref:Uncharacterized protein n=1 Tax=Paenibacillus arenilitoris TaxID=2772299 RepID=A0A927CQQ1_9BACL|nr:hypothetical protein [Paenibacillus arenilitoris]MBD2872004.1 hypothetical protein [Paenibacillus arenilitoris]
MSETREPAEEQHEPGRYEFRLKGHLDARWTCWFEGLSLTNESDGTTILTVEAADQPALHGLLRKIRDLGLPLVSVIQVDPKQANRQEVNEDTNPNQSGKKETNT